MRASRTNINEHEEHIFRGYYNDESDLVSTENNEHKIEVPQKVKTRGVHNGSFQHTFLPYEEDPDDPSKIEEEEV